MFCRHTYIPFKYLFDEPFNLFISIVAFNRVRPVRVRGGNTKYRALRLESGNFSWGSECMHVI